MNMLIRTPGQLGAHLRNVRKAKGWTQTELAGRSGLRQEYISRIESGHESVTIVTLLKLMGALGLDLSLSERKSSANIGDVF